MTPENIDRIARKRANAKLGWLMHASIYLIVNAFLIALSLWQGKAWAAFPLLGWSLGLAIHGTAVWFQARVAHCARAWCNASGRA